MSRLWLLDTAELGSFCTQRTETLVSWSATRRGNYCDWCDAEITVVQMFKNARFMVPPLVPYLCITWFGKPVLVGADYMLCHSCGKQAVEIALKHFKQPMVRVSCVECGKRIEMGAESALAKIDHRLNIRWDGLPMPLSDKVKDLTFCLTDGLNLLEEFKPFLKGKVNV